MALRDTCLIPQQVTADSATLMVGVRGARQPALSVATTQSTQAVTLERFPAAGDALLRFGRVRFDALAPDTRLRFELRDADGTVLDVAHMTTLPARVGGPSAPFRMLLGSCFSRGDDAGLGTAIAALPGGAKPRVKLFCGDQVYLDTGRIRLGASSETTRELIAENYWRAFNQQPQGFGDVLRDGGNYFLSDDHEFYNNAPFPSIVAWRTRDDDYRSAFLAAARTLYRAWQGNYTGLHGFDVAPLSVRLLDTRIARDAQLDRLTTDTDAAALEAWVAGLQGPGVLALGQPLFDEPAENPNGFTGDANLPSYRQYAALLAVLGRSRHPLVLLTGDVHFGRIASCELPGNVRVLEIVSSPMAQLWGAQGRFRAAPRTLAASAGSAFHAREVRTDPGFTTNRDHFLTLDFWSVGPAVHLSVKRWRVNPAAAVPEAIHPELTL
jgi:hypothetical protein